MKVDHARKLQCEARTHAFATSKCIWIRCNDKACPDVQNAKKLGMQAVHLFEVETGTLLGTDFRPPHRPKKGHN